MRSQIERGWRESLDGEQKEEARYALVGRDVDLPRQVGQKLSLHSVDLLHTRRGTMSVLAIRRKRGRGDARRVPRAFGP